MDTLTFISEMVKSLVWPVTVLALVVILKKPIVELVPLLKHLKYKELELEFSEQVMELKAEAESHKKERAESEAGSSNPYEDMVSFSTRAAIIESWLAVESAAEATAMSFWNQDPSKIISNLNQLGEYLHKCNVLDKNQLNTFHKLRQLRNKVAHEQDLELSEKDAKIYVRLAYDLAEHIRNA